MDRKWICALMGLVIIGTVFAVGSIAGEKVTNSFFTNKASGENDFATVYTRANAGNYTQWFVVSGDDTEPYLLYTVPPRTFFQIDEIVLTNDGDAGYSMAEIYRGTQGNQGIMQIQMQPHTSFYQHFDGLVLRPGEQIKIFSVASGPAASSVGWTITGHRF